MNFHLKGCLFTREIKSISLLDNKSVLILFHDSKLHLAEHFIIEKDEVLKLIDQISTLIK